MFLVFNDLDDLDDIKGGIGELDLQHLCELLLLQCSTDPFEEEERDRKLNHCVKLLDSVGHQTHSFYE